MAKSNIHYFAFAAGALLGACSAPAAGTQPHSMSAVEHQAAAQQEAAESGGHSGQYDGTARSFTKRCEPGLGLPPGYPVVRNPPNVAPYPQYRVARFCWTDELNPTDAHKKSADEHRAIAAQHRAASEVLRDAEARACAGLTDEDRDMSPFSQRSDIQSVTPLREKVSSGYDAYSPDDPARSGALRGATVAFRALPGLTAQYLQRVVDCHLARNAAIGHEAAGAEMAYCPLTERGARATVRPLNSAFAVDIQAEDAAGAERIWQRAQKLAVAR